MCAEYFLSLFAFAKGPIVLSFVDVSLLSSRQDEHTSHPMYGCMAAWLHAPPLRWMDYHLRVIQFVGETRGKSQPISRTALYSLFFFSSWLCFFLVVEARKKKRK